MTAIEVGFIDIVHPAIRAALEQGMPPGWSVRFAAGRGAAEQAAAVAEAELLLLIGFPVPAALVAAAPRLRAIQKLGAGVDKIDLEACRARGIAVARLEAGNNVPVAEHTVMMMLACCRRLPLIDRRTRAGAWDKEESRGINRGLEGKRVGLVGFGAIGRSVARCLGGFNVEIVYYDTQRAPPEVEQALAARPLPLDELVESADIVSLHCPLLPATRDIISAERIARMKPGAILVNCARGGLVDEAALAEALAAGRLMAAGLDTFNAEPPVRSPLLALDNTVITSHMAGATLDNFARVLGRGIANLQAFLAGRGFPDGDRVLPEG